MGRSARRLRAKLRAKFSSEPQAHSSPESVLEHIREPRDGFDIPRSQDFSSPRTRTSSFSATKEKVVNSALFPKSYKTTREFRKTTPDHSVHSIDASALYAHPQQVDNWLLRNPDADHATRTSLDRLAGVPTAVWLDDPDTRTVRHRASKIALNAKNRSQLYQVVLCCAPLTTTGNRTTRNSYLTYVRTVAKAMSKSPGIIIVEPEAMYEMTSTDTEQSVRNALLDLLCDAMNILRQYSPQARVYLDVGRIADANDVAKKAKLLKMAGVCTARGFAINTSQSHTTRECLLYAQNLRRILGDKIHFVVDTSRNGVGAKQGPRRNNFALRIGEEPTTRISKFDPLSSGLDALLWIKPPGLSDGNHHGRIDTAPPAGLFWLDSALSLIGVHDEQREASEISNES